MIAKTMPNTEAPIADEMISPRPMPCDAAKSATIAPIDATLMNAANMEQSTDAVFLRFVFSRFASGVSTKFIFDNLHW
ncbi:hypothetical protein BcepF1.125 [Burkholderia phage BcepF1]|uniref:Uncharacterized protein n=1 Tax=Burkholderia phage BcepF1 TaxID=2886897 RepID=A1Z029_9CAUD|nr:hypothetical protein BcepF1.125 [Burkholderia phage BcepF1]ABL96856.1 hypothetical protein BcepF1.125 [Burkholderia phage BcepF1]